MAVYNDQEIEQTREEKIARQREEDALHEEERQIFLESQAQKAADEGQEGDSTPHIELIAYGPALIVAVFKDILDFIGVGSLPVVGTVVTFMVIIAILMIFFFRAPRLSSSPKSVFLFRTAPLLLGGTIAEGFLFGLNLLPLTTAIVMSVYLREKTLSLALSAPLAAATKTIKKP